VQIGGPTGAFVVIVYGIVQKYGLDGLTIATIMGGLLLIAFGLARLGGAIKFIPFPVVTGFTSGIAAILIVHQLRGVLGLSGRHWRSRGSARWNRCCRRWWLTA
jgi:SulP family sulfate permease